MSFLRADGATESGISRHGTFLLPTKVTEVPYKTQKTVSAKLPFFPSLASLLLANKVPMKMIQDWLGHSDMSTTANIYSHVDHTSKLASAEVIGNILGA